MDELLKLLITSPNTITDIIQQYKPMLYVIFEELFGVYKDWVNNDDYFRYVAEFDWKRMCALQEAGFSRKEAFAIILDGKEKLNDRLNRSSQINK